MGVKKIDLEKDLLYFDCPTCQKEREICLNNFTNSDGVYFSDNEIGPNIRLPRCECGALSFMVISDKKCERANIRRIAAKRLMELYGAKHIGFDKDVNIEELIEKAIKKIDECEKRK